MTKLEEQICELSPSVKDALFRRLLFAEDLGWLREEDKKGQVIGFEVDLDDQELSGFSLIAIQRHTVIAYVSDRNEDPRLILFPALETLFDPGFELLDLIVTRKEFKDSTFDGISTGHGRFGDMVKDLTPPNRKVDISNTVLDQISHIIEKEEEEFEKKGEPPQPIAPEPAVAEPAIQEPDEPMYEPPYEEGPPEGFIGDEPDDFDNYEEQEDFDDSGSDYEDYEDEPEPEQETPLTRSELIKSQKFAALNDVVDFAVMKLGVNRPLAVTLVNKAMQSKVAPEYRIELAVNIFCKLIDEGKI